MEIPGYEILGKLGEGGTATVWKARQIALDRLVALKVMNRAQTDDSSALEQFRTEGLAAAKLSHRNIVQVFDAGEINGSPYFAMEFVEGQSLGDIIARKGKLKPDQALAVAESVAVALKHAWNRAQIIHCDIKPDNILIEKYGVVKVADLGLARILSRREGHAERDVIGTPNYVSPEQAQGGLDLDYRSDIYSLGATLYHTVTGLMPFAPASGSAAMDMHIHEYLHDPMEINPDIQSPVAWLIEKMMIRNRADRYASWTEVIEDIELVMGGKMPMPPLPENGQSTVVRCAAREQPSARPAPDTVVPASRPPPAEARVEQPETPNIAVNPVQMRAKLGKVMEKHQAPPASAQNLVLKFGIAAAIAVLTYWMWQKLNSTTPTAPPPDVFATNDPMHKVIRPANQSAAAPEPPAPNPVPDFVPVHHTSNELRVIQESASLGWDDTEYQRAAAMYNNALRAYGDYMQTRENPAVLKRIEANVRIAIDYFEKCKDRAPKRYDVQGLIDKCNKLLFDVHASTQITP